MTKRILITGSTDGIGLETAKLFAKNGHEVILHGRTQEKLAAAEDAIKVITPDAVISGFIADFSSVPAVNAFADEILSHFDHIDVLINNAGIFRTNHTTTADGLDIRFAVNTIAPWVLTQRLLPILGKTGRVVNLTSAAQAGVDADGFLGKKPLDAMDAYSQSKLALIQWSRYLANALGGEGPVIIPVNPGSLLATKMVKEGFGVPGKSTSIGAQVLVDAALSDTFANKSGRYFDNDVGQFADPHPSALDEAQVQETMRILKSLV
ncbi:SDR family NAD(P)-dependent oxidoreductase [Microbulbifer agarilyticus]